MLLNFRTDDTRLERNGDNLVFNFDDGARIEVTDFYTLYRTETIPEFQVAGQPVPGVELFTALNARDILPPIDRGHYHEWDSAGSLTDGLNHDYGSIGGLRHNGSLGILDSLDWEAATKTAEWTADGQERALIAGFGDEPRFGFTVSWNAPTGRDPDTDSPDETSAGKQPHPILLMPPSLGAITLDESFLLNGTHQGGNDHAVNAVITLPDGYEPDLTGWTRESKATATARKPVEEDETPAVQESGDTYILSVHDGKGMLTWNDETKTLTYTLTGNYAHPDNSALTGADESLALDALTLNLIHTGTQETVTASLSVNVEDDAPLVNPVAQIAAPIAPPPLSPRVDSKEEEGIPEYNTPDDPTYELPKGGGDNTHNTSETGRIDFNYGADGFASLSVTDKDNGRTMIFTQSDTNKTKCFFYEEDDGSLLDVTVDDNGDVTYTYTTDAQGGRDREFVFTATDGDGDSVSLDVRVDTAAAGGADIPSDDDGGFTDDTVQDVVPTLMATLDEGFLPNGTHRDDNATVAEIALPEGYEPDLTGWTRAAKAAAKKPVEEDETPAVQESGDTYILSVHDGKGLLTWDDETKTLTYTLTGNHAHPDNSAWTGADESLMLEALTLNLIHTDTQDPVTASLSVLVKDDAPLVDSFTWSDVGDASETGRIDFNYGADGFASLSVTDGSKTLTLTKINERGEIIYDDGSRLYVKVGEYGDVTYTYTPGADGMARQFAFTATDGDGDSIALIVNAATAGGADVPPDDDGGFTLGEGFFIPPDDDGGSTGGTDKDAGGTGPDTGQKDTDKTMETQNQPMGDDDIIDGDASTDTNANSQQAPQAAQAAKVAQVPRSQDRTGQNDDDHLNGDDDYLYDDNGGYLYGGGNDIIYHDTSGTVSIDGGGGMDFLLMGDNSFLTGVSDISNVEFVIRTTEDSNYLRTMHDTTDLQNIGITVNDDGSVTLDGWTAAPGQQHDGYTAFTKGDYIIEADNNLVDFDMELMTFTLKESMAA
jgi:hypothetical protein